ncbi:hypothetical protein CN378_09365 [Bacillus sp. AFS015802]|uniref:hypothetical protein n=1 Tax=Bacillus sp. AFS015802 TaxID=2033486 RepID=UPI000BF76552|nr:hypothetical protein [Bacillus sp. AFS015802]PFA67723.1 hypothetical protein CN378_09365 [Bacillus sp. AFS015802]
MYLVLGCLLLGIVGVFLIAGRVAPQSELLNSFKKTNSFRNILITLTVISGILFILNYVVVKNEEWRESAIIQVENDEGEIELFQGEKNEAAIAFNKTFKAKKEYQTSLLVWGHHENLIIFLEKKGEEDSVEQIEVKNGLSRFTQGAYSVPIILSFKEAGLWKITVEDNRERVGDIVIEVDK